MKLAPFLKSQIPCAIAALVAVTWGTNSIAQAQNQDTLPEEVVNTIANKTIAKFNNSSCQELAASMAQQHSKPQPETLKDRVTARFIQRLRQDPQLTQQFFSQISTPVLTKLFECGLVPPRE
jgi:hypothetical protein